MCRYSDNDGATWSADRYLVPYPDTWIDRHNTFNGSYHIMWTVDQIKRLPAGLGPTHKSNNDSVGFGFTKIGTYIQSPPEEVFFMVSPNLLREPNVSAVEWDLYPHGDHGVRAPVSASTILDCL